MSQNFPGTRRSLLTTLPVAAAGAAVVGVAAKATTPEQSIELAAGDTRLRLAREADGTGMLEVPLGRRFEREGRGWRTGPLATSGFNMAAVTWPHDQKSPRIRVRARDGGTWGDWKVLPLQSDHAADGMERGAREGTDLVWLGRNKDVEVAFLDAKPAGAKLTLIDTTVTELDRRIPDDPVERTLRTAAKAPRPYFRHRRVWGANEKLNNGHAGYCWTVKQIHLHHTAGSNSYSKADVPGILRGIHRYHTQSLGWSDIGYNYLIDKWGRAWVGRQTKNHNLAARGAHTLGFNHMSVGIAVIGNFQSTQPSDAVIQMIIKLSAWKLDIYGRNPNGTVKVKSEGSDKYPKGRVLTMPVMNGHRDTNDTSCPGWQIYKRLDFIRRRTKQRVDNFS